MTQTGHYATNYAGIGGTRGMNIVSTQSENNEEGQTSVNEKRRIEKQKWVSCSKRLNILHSDTFSLAFVCGSGLWLWSGFDGGKTDNPFQFC